VKEYHLAIILLMSISCNLDNVGIGIAYGARGVSIPFDSNLLIAFITTSGTFVSAVCGQSLYLVLKPELARYIGSAIIICMGIWIIGQEFIIGGMTGVCSEHIADRAAADQKGLFAKVMMVLDNPCAADADLSNHIDLKEGTVLGLALTLNNIANGVGAGMIGLNIMWLTVFVFILSIVTIWVGIRIGDRYGQRIFGRLTGLVAGAILVLTGIYEIIS
jgi:putative sporulation protein YtaF